MLLALALALAADSGFTARVDAAKALEKTTEGHAWQEALWTKIGNPATDALRDCVASNQPADKTPFTIVATIDPQGRSSNVAVHPETPVSKCFTGQFSVWTLPPPPKKPAPYPFEIDVSMGE
jgi:hypothetical protein